MADDIATRRLMLMASDVADTIAGLVAAALAASDTVRIERIARVRLILDEIYLRLGQLLPSEDPAPPPAAAQLTLPLEPGARVNP